MSDTQRTVKLDLRSTGFASVERLLATGQSAAAGTEVSLEPYAVFIGELRK
jgi:hypothetical protein